jgi:hypothetical protein
MRSTHFTWWSKTYTLTVYILQVLTFHLKFRFFMWSGWWVNALNIHVLLLLQAFVLHSAINGLWYMDEMICWWWICLRAHVIVHGLSSYVPFSFQAHVTYIMSMGWMFYMLSIFTPISFRLMVWKHLHLHFQFTFCKCSRFIFNIQSYLLDGSWLMV